MEEKAKSWMKQAALAVCSALGLQWPAGVTVELQEIETGFRVSEFEPSSASGV